MKEIQFIKQNKDRWESYVTPTSNPDELANRFVSLIDDLGYAKTNYPLSNTVPYLNNIASGIYLSIYKNRKKEPFSLKKYFGTTIPLTIYQYRKPLLFALIFFVVMYVIGIFLSQKSPTFIRSILGDSYVNMTNDNIAKGKPFGVYDSSNELIMFFQIAWNNVKVALLTFCSGVLFIVGSLFIMFQNGIMVGSFHQMFINHGLGAQWGLIVMIHGTLELFSIAIAGGCGVMLGSAVLFPGTYKRIESLKKAAVDALKIMLIVVLMLIVAAIFESFVTRYETMPIWLNISILVNCVSFIIWYFFRLPNKAHKLQTQEFEEYKQTFLRYH